MHVTRPKSSKGRTRPNVAQQNPTLSPRPPPPRRGGNPAVLAETLQSPPEAPVPPLNKYRVLPSIDKRPEGRISTSDLEKKISALSLSSNSILDQRLQQQQQQRRGPGFLSLPASRSGTVPGAWGGFSEDVPARVMTRHPEDGAGDEDLLLAVRTPSGERVECCFRPTDTLSVVVDVAGAAAGRRFEHAVVDTMEFPRRTFTDLSATLSQCGILNKSVLCVSLENGNSN